MATSAVTQWDASGTPISGGDGPTQWDASGNPIAPANKFAAQSGKAVSAAPPAAASPGPAGDLAQGLTANPRGEGIYQMRNPGQQAAAIPYSNVRKAMDQGYLFADKGTLQQYARDHAADPLSEDRVDQWIDKHPYLSRPLQGILGAGTGALKTFTGADRTPTSRFETEMQLAAATPPHTAAEAGAEGAENLGEFFAGDELLGMLGKAAQALPWTERLKQASQIGAILNKYPMLAKLAKIGSSVVKQGTIAAAQTYAKTGEPLDAATSGALAAGGAGTLDLGSGSVAALRTAAHAAPEAEAAATEAAERYAAEARGALRPHLETAAHAGEGLGAPPAAVGGMQIIPRTALAAHGVATAAAATGPRAPLFDVNAVLNQVHDFTGAADRGVEVADPMYSAIDKATGGRFRALNAEVQAAQAAKWKGAPDAAENYRNKLAQMDDLLDKAKAAGVTPEIVQSAKGLFRQTYILRDFGKMWDRSLNGVPGATKVSQAQRGVDGKMLMRELQHAVRVYTRPQIEQALGPGRLESLEDIARATQTQAQRQSFYKGIRAVAYSMEKGAVLGGVTGHFAGSWAGGAAVGAGVAGAAEMTGRVTDAIKINPKIAQNFLYALESGAASERYGPFVAEMIQKWETEGSREEQRQADETGASQ